MRARFSAAFRGGLLVAGRPAVYSRSEGSNHNISGYAMGARSAIASMTGFARAETTEGERHWSWELKSVNGRSLDLRCRLPAGLEALEPTVRQLVAVPCKRGNITVQLDASRRGTAHPVF